MLVVHAGNRIDGADRAHPRFPPERELAISNRLGELLDMLEPDGVVTAAAAGADLLLVEAAQERHLPIHLVLPTERRCFRATSVEDQGERWAFAFDRAINLVTSHEPNSLVELALESEGNVFSAGNQALINRARDMAENGVVAVAVRPAGGEDPSSMTDDFVGRAKQAGLFVIEIDPRG